MLPIKKKKTTKNKRARHAWNSILKQQHTERSIKYESSWRIQKKTMITAANRKEEVEGDLKHLGADPAWNFLSPLRRHRA